MNQRPIKFRAWVGNEMFYGVAVVDGKPGTVFRSEDSIETRFEEFNESNLMQFTGLHDKNGKEIYEGDIIKCHCGMPSCIPIKPEPIDMWDGLVLKGTEPLLEVIGNIYENPELLAKATLTK